MSLLDKASLVITPNGYKENVLYSVVPNTTLGDMDVVRATTATRVNSLGLIESVANNVPRIDYTNGSCPSLLVEPQRTNLALYSEELDNGTWNKFGSLAISANSTTSPTGVSNADKVIPNATTGTFAISQSFTKATSNIIYTFSGYAKQSGYNFLLIRFDSGAGNGIKGSFNISNGTIATAFSSEGVGFTFINADIKNANNGWVKWSITLTSDSLPLLRPIIYVSNTDGNPFLPPSYTANGTSGVFIWGAQLEQGSYPTSYIPTVASTVTRNADVISKTGISSLIGQTEGTIFIEATNKVLGNTDRTMFFVTDASADDFILVRYSSDGPNIILFAILIDGAFVLLTSKTVTGSITKIALKYNAGVYKVFINGSLQHTQSGSGFTSNLANVYLGSSGSSEQLAEGINSFQIYKTALTDTECNQLTTL